MLKQSKDEWESSERPSLLKAAEHSPVSLFLKINSSADLILPAGLCSDLNAK